MDSFSGSILDEGVTLASGTPLIPESKLIYGSKQE